MSELTGKKGIKAFLLAHVGKIVTTEQIKEASGNKGQYGRRLRELRDEEGRPIESHHDASDFAPHEYRLADLPPGRPPVRLQRNISAKLRAQVLDRNGFTCQMCGIAADEIGEDDRKAVLHVGHIKPKSEAGLDEVSNLRALCRMCNQGAKNVVTIPPDRKWLLSQVRRANAEDQRAVLAWLQRKFGNQTS